MAKIIRHSHQVIFASALWDSRSHEMVGVSRS